jgi:rare lipoprotein A
MLLAGCAPKVALQQGDTSWYGPGFRGKPTASGEIFRPGRRTAAHRTLPFGTVLLVERVDSGRRVRVVVNDRGPFVGGRILDLAKGAARRLKMIDDGVVEVRIYEVGCRRSRGCGGR